MDQQDLEAVTPTPDHGLSPPSIEEPSGSFFSRRKRAVVAAVALVVAAGVAVGVAVAVRPKNESSLGQAQMQAGNDAIREESTNESSDISSGYVYDESADESVDDPIDVDDETKDIIMDVGSDIEFPEDLIYTSGYEREPELEETTGEITVPVKIPFNSEDFSMETIEFDGPITDFIVTPDLARIAASSAKSCPNANEGLWKMTLETDNYPWETWWELVDNKGTVLASGPPKGRNYARSTKYIGQMCFKAGQYRVRLGDKNKDGICCTYGRGNMDVKVNGKTVAQSDNKAFELNTYQFKITPAFTNPPPTPPPTRKPNTRRPTPKPTPKPQNLNPQGWKCVDIEVVTDRFASETSYTFKSLATGRVYIEKNEGELGNEQTYKDTECVPDGRYELKVVDPFQGIQEGGYYSVTVDGQEVMYGTTFQGGSDTHIIHVGFEPQMTPRERQWLNSHNQRRRDFYQEEGVPFKKLVWSNKLAEDASQWVDRILPTCKITRQQGLEEGENISARTSVGQRDEGPEAILYRWADAKQGKGYPGNQSMTQVFWKATRYVGCSEKSLRRQSGTWCYVTICRYARAGNCAMRQYPDWKSATLTDRTGCGPSCPVTSNGKVCY
eukprot:CAMPEP_0183743034 /NCGR_PEP_ID=MMETSP0737-20130205/65009_1 /TAXON_ID=385413 /ORGANISM="Thalassiosira miniscula, Strain CCMP1093" /LENGTH=611 /DNA_ID=CAMNT_0025978637 /DNA_START=577 /DNA_END=2412 /DNA_ORIENTATION=+